METNGDISLNIVDAFDNAFVDHGIVGVDATEGVSRVYHHGDGITHDGRCRLLFVVLAILQLNHLSHSNRIGLDSMLGCHYSWYDTLTHTHTHAHTH